MKKYFFVIPLILFLFVVLVFFYFLIKSRNPAEIPSALIDKMAPAIEASYLYDNKNFIYENIFGKQVTIVNFFATWCIPCILEHSYIEKLSKNNNIVVLGINYKDDPKKTIEWLEKLGDPYSHVVVDLDGQIGLDWGVYGLPETFIVNEEGTIVFKQVGPITEKNYKNFYDKVLETIK